MARKMTAGERIVAANVFGAALTRKIDRAIKQAVSAERKSVLDTIADLIGIKNDKLSQKITIDYKPLKARKKRTSSKP